jgi:hypothetical protein
MTARMGAQRGAAQGFEEAAAVVCPPVLRQEFEIFSKTGCMS